MPTRHLPQLDGLRGIAILIVLIGHLLALDLGFGMRKLAPIAPLGVDLFFVLSGFLITSNLLRAKGTRFFFRNFYFRRALRIAPLYYVLLIFVFGMAHTHLAAFSFNTSSVHWQVFALYLQNVYYHHIEELGPVFLAVTWSLAVEEQFYLVWPACVSKLNFQRLSAIALALVFVAPLARVLAPKLGYDPYINPICRMDAMALGSLVAIWSTAVKPASQQVKRIGRNLMLIAIVGYAACCVTGLEHVLGRSFILLSITALLVLSGEIQFLTRALSMPALRLTGRYSYCLYLAHSVVGCLVLMKLQGTGVVASSARSVLILLLSYAVAWLSWNFFESPLLRLKVFFEVPTSPKATDGADKAAASLRPVLEI